MKFLLALFLTLGLSHADEMQRLDLIVQDITQLRSDYEVCEEKVQALQVKLQDEKDRNSILLQEVNEADSFANKEKKYTNVIAKLKREIDKQKKKIRQLSNSENNVPVLEMKDDFKNTTLLSQDKKLFVFEARPFRLNKESDIYSDLDGTIIDRWENATSFTSDTKTTSMVKITGYFVDQVWRRSKKEMWVKLENATQR